MQKALAKKEKEERKKLKELEASYRIEAMRDKPASSTENFSSVSSLEDCNFIDEVSSEAGLGNLSTGTGSGTGFSILSFKFRQEAGSGSGLGNLTCHITCRQTCNLFDRQTVHFYG